MQSTAAEVVTEPTLILAAPEHMEKLWPLAAPHLQSVFDRSGGRVDAQSLANEIMTGSVQLWLVWDGERCLGVVGTDFGPVSTGLMVCTIRFCSGGHLDTWLHLRIDIEAWARSQGCQKIEAVARKGWAKRLPDYQMTHVVLEKDL